jgi:hypothetical protein
MKIEGLIPVIVAVLGLGMYLLGDRDRERPHPKVVELGRLMFFAGLFVWLLAHATRSVSLP